MNQVERNRTTFLRLYDEVFNQGSIDVIDECVAANAIDHGHPLADDAADLRTHVREIVTMLRGAMPDVHVTVEETVAEDDKVFGRLTTTGTHTGRPLFGIAASGRRVHVAGFHLVEFDSRGRIVRDAGEFCVDEIMRQVKSRAA
jgi:predicted ester cyclase